MPVGARRCVQCRSLVGEPADIDAMNAVTRMGAGNPKDNTRADNGRNFQDQPMTHQTMIGLGPISAPSSRRSSEDLSRNFGQQTIAGMPGISFDSNARQGGYRMAASAHTPDRGLSPVKAKTENVWDDPPYSSDSNHTAHAPQTHTPTAKSENINIPELTFPEEDDALAGMPGASVVPSSLVDEEFDDLTSKLFGDDFVIEQDDDDDEDGLDFDVPTDPTPVTPQPKPVVNIPATQPMAHRQEKKTTQTTNKTPKKTTQTTNKTINKSPKKSKKQPSKQQILCDKIAIISTCIAAALFLFWIVFALVDNSQNNAEIQGSNLPAAIVAILNIAASAICALLFKSLKTIHIMAIIGSLTIALFIAMVAGGANTILLLLAGMLCQVICVSACFLKN